MTYEMTGDLRVLPELAASSSTWARMWGKRHLFDSENMTCKSSAKAQLPPVPRPFCLSIRKKRKVTAGWQETLRVKN